ncbi:MAG TPA: FAD-dependent oxidoreductase [Patescibacteria group bacterium]|nr:FAD-dependent oxidoreductase [Patescibacteria group bacterium]
MQQGIGNIVIAGGGYAGVTAARFIARFQHANPTLKEAYRVVVIDHADRHRLAFRYTSALLAPANTSTKQLIQSMSIPFKDIFTRGSDDTVFVQSTITSIDPDNRLMYLRDNNPIDYMYLIVALGSEPWFGSVVNAPRFCFSLSSMQDVFRMRARLNKLLRNSSPSRITIIGAGMLGCDIAGALACHPLYTQSNIMITLIEKENRVVPDLSPRISSRVLKRLSRLGVRVCVSASVEAVQKDAVLLKSGEALLSDMTIWAGGTRPPLCVRALPFEHDEIGRVYVNEYLQARPDVLILGTNAHMQSRAGKRIPVSADTTIRQGRYAACAVDQFTRHAQPPFPFPAQANRYRVPVGTAWAVYYRWHVFFSGIVGCMVTRLSRAWYLLNIMGAVRLLLRAFS